MTTVKVFWTFLLTLIITATFAQVREKCATMPYNEQLKKKLGPGYSTQKFEQWVADRIQKHKEIAANSRTQENTYLIPVVVHIIHNGEAEGVESNIPIEQVQEQIKILTQDFRRTNPDADKTPPLFQKVASDVNVEFKLAVRDPDGAPTNGIIRVNGRRQIWYFEDGDNLKKISFWPSEDYLNIWVANLGNNTLGFSQFPTSDLLPGLDEGSPIRETDGVVIHYKEFGRGGNATKRSRGRTLTHEIGHFFGLKHIWGDDDGACDGDDHVDDTPNQGGPNNSCPRYPSSTCGNSSDMFMNFLDYTPDTCMNMFSLGQKFRMRTILQNSPRRKSLLSSNALILPTPATLDVALTKIIYPAEYVCESTIVPVVLIRNLGTVNVNKVMLDYSINGSTPITIFKAVDIKPFDSVRLVLDGLPNISTAGINTFTVTVKNPNNGTDQRPENSSKTVNFTYGSSTPLPYNEVFDNLSLFSVKNPDQQKTWEIKSTGGTGNKAAYIDYYDLNTSYQEKDYLISPTVNASSYDSLSLSFKYAYANKGTMSSTALSVVVSMDCGNNFKVSNEVFFRSGQSLETAFETTEPFVPTEEIQWREECINLQNYAGYENIKIAFIASSGGGNNLYIDDVELKYGNCNFGFPVGFQKEKPKNVDVKVSPNPNDGTMYLDMRLPFSDDLVVTVINSLGQIVLEQKIGRTNNLHHLLEIPGATPGMHVVKIKGNKINLNKKIIIR